MKLHLIKRVGMLAASTAVLTAGIFGALSLNGLRYVRPTAENWTLLAYIEPAEQVEQQVEILDGDRLYTMLVGYDAQERPLWSLTSTRPFGIDSSVKYRYNGRETTQYIANNGVKCTQHIQQDELGRTIRVEYWNGETVVSTYRGEESEPYLEQARDPQGALEYETLYEYDRSTGNTTVKKTVYEADGTVSTELVVTDRHGFVTHTESDSPDEVYLSQSGWIYDESTNTAFRVQEDGSTSKQWYDNEQRLLRREDRNPDGSLFSLDEVEYTDVTR